MAKLNKTVIKALQEIQATSRVTQEVGKPLLEQGLIEVNVEDVVDGMALARLTSKALAAIPNITKNFNEGISTVNTDFSIITNAVLPPSKRGNRLGSGAPPKYPFATMEVGNSFFVPVTEKMPNPLKSMGSTVAVQNHKYSEPTGEIKKVERTKRGPKNRAVTDEAGNKVREVVDKNVRKPVRKFSIRAVTAGEKYGDWIAPTNGALIARTL
jgi:hypothetical protein